MLSSSLRAANAAKLSRLALFFGALRLIVALLMGKYNTDFEACQVLFVHPAVILSMGTNPIPSIHSRGKFLGQCPVFWTRIGNGDSPDVWSPSHFSEISSCHIIHPSPEHAPSLGLDTLRQVGVALVKSVRLCGPEPRSGLCHFFNATD